MVSNVIELDEKVKDFINAIWKEAVGDLNELFNINSDLKQITIEKVYRFFKNFIFKIITHENDLKHDS
jgi:hypothetical protein